MQNNILLDVTNKKGLTAVVIAYGGRIVDRVTYESKYDNQYENLIEGYIRGSKLLKSFFDKNGYIEGDLIVVSSNSALVSWFKRNYALAKYTDMFSSLTLMLESLPIKIEYVRSDELISTKYALKSFITRENLSAVTSIID